MSRLFILSLAFLVFVPLAHAEDDFEPGTTGSEPLDSHSESRLDKYVRRRKCPVTYDQAFLDRCQYLNRRANYLYDKQTQGRSISREERRRIQEEKEAVLKNSVGITETEFNPTGPGADPLDIKTESRVKRYVANFNCPAARLREPALSRCIFLLREVASKKRDLTERRLARAMTRLPARTVNLSPGLNRRSETTLTREQQDIILTERKELSVYEDFDMTGPGSEPLKEAHENRLARYVDGDKCPITLNRIIKERCSFLLRLRRFQRSKQLKQARTRTQIRDALRQNVIRRGVDLQYQSRVPDISAEVRVRQAQTSTRIGRPRNLQELEQYYGVKIRRSRGETIVE